MGDSFIELGKSPHIRHKQIIGILPPDYKLSNFTNAVWRMVKTDCIEKVVKNGEPYLRLTGEGKRALVRDFPILSLRAKKWDGFWRVVFYDIAEKQRNVRETLQYKLLRLGFGQLQKSVYVSPLEVADDVREFIENRGLGDYVFVGVCKRLLAGDDKQLAARAWALGQLNERYGEIMYDMDDFATGRSEMNLSQLYTKFEEVVLDDPFLPKELLPDWWLGDRAIRQMKELLTNLR